MKTIIKLIKNIIPVKRHYLISKYDNKTVIGSTCDEDLKHCLTQDNVYSKPYLAWRNSSRPIFGESKIEKER